VTGAASGIGRHLCGALLREGDVVAAADLDASCLARVSEEDRWPEGRSELLAFDVRDPEAWARTVETVLARRGRLDLLLNVAGVLRPASVLDIQTADVDLQIDVNLKGVIHGTRAAAARMKAGAGHIVNFASLAALSPIPGLSLYTASKFAVRGFSLAAAHELKPLGIAVTVICPDAVRTPMLDLQKAHPEAALTFSGAPLDVQDVAAALFRRVLPHRPLEVVLPFGRGLLAKLAGAFPRAGFALAPILVRKGLAAQQRHRTGGGKGLC